MKYTKIFRFSLAGSMALSMTLLANAASLANNPYQPIATRNVFGLNAIATSPARMEPPAPLAKISLTGLATILGVPEVLCKVSNPDPSDKPEKCFILGEGEVQDDIEVVSIDMKNTLVVFKNHGVIQKIPLGIFRP